MCVCVRLLKISSVCTTFNDPDLLLLQLKDVGSQVCMLSMTAPVACIKHKTGTAQLGYSTCNLVHDKAKKRKYQTSSNIFNI